MVMLTGLTGLVRTAAVVTAVFTAPAHAAFLTLTQAGLDAGFTLATVVDGIVGGTRSCCFVLGSAVNSDGKIILNNGNNGNSGTNYLYNNVNNQIGTAAAISSASNAGFPTAMANANGVVYAGGGNFRRLNNDGSTAQTYAGINVSAGLWTNPINQHLIAVGSASGVGSGLLDIDVSGPTPVARRINGAGTDGLTVSPDGQVVYTNSAAYSIATGSLIASYAVSGADGMAVISSSNALNGNLIVSTTGGSLVMLDPDNNFSTQIQIANLGGYGDFVSPDYTTGTLLVSSGDSLLRLGCGAGCGIGVTPPPVTGVPEPTALWALSLAAMGLATTVRRRNAGSQSVNDKAVSA